MIVLVGGMQRSGSTFVFNIVREILKISGKVATITSNSLVEGLQESHGCEHLVMKSHGPDRLTTDLILKSCVKCVCSFRTPEDAIASWSRMFGGNLQNMIEMFGHWFQWHALVKNSVLNISYEKIEHDTLGCILTIQEYLFGKQDLDQARYLSEEYSKERVKRRYEALEKGASTINAGSTYYDKETFFHRRHVVSLQQTRATDFFTDCEIEEIREKLRPYLDSDGHCEISIPDRSSREQCHLSSPMSGSCSDCSVSRGFVYVAFGAQCANEAKNSITSLRAAGNTAPVAIFTDTEDNIFNADFHYYVNTPWSGSEKIIYLRDIPFDAAVFLDTDTYITDTIEELFDLLLRYDIAAAHAPGYRGLDDPTVPEAFYELNCGVLCIKKSMQMDLFLADWLNERIAGAQVQPSNQIFTREQPMFRRMLWKHALNLYVLPQEYNYRSIFCGFLRDKAKIIHGRHADMDKVARKINNKSGMGTYKPFDAQGNKAIVENTADNTPGKSKAAPRDICGNVDLYRNIQEALTKYHLDTTSFLSDALVASNREIVKAIEELLAQFLKNGTALTAYPSGTAENGIGEIVKQSAYVRLPQAEADKNDIVPCIHEIDAMARVLNEMRCERKNILNDFVNICKSACYNCGSSNFSEKLYLDMNPDVEVAVRGRQIQSGFQHWIRYGHNEGRKAMFMDTK